MFPRSNFSWRSQFNILWCGYAVLMAAASMSIPYWSFYLMELLPDSPNAVKYWTSLIYLAPFISGALFAPFWGWVGDRFGYKPMLVRACIGLVITQLLLIFTTNVIVIFAIRLLQGALAGVIVATQAWALAISPKEHHGVVIGKLHSALAIGELIGPLLGGLVANLFGYQGIFIFAAISSLIITVFFVFILKPSPKPPIESKVSCKNDVNASENKLLIHSEVMIMLLLVILFTQLSRSVFTPFFGLFVFDTINGGNLAVGLLSSATALTVFASAPFWGRYFDKLLENKFRAYLALAVILSVTAILQILHLFVSSFSQLLIIRLGWGIIMGVLIPTLLRLLIVAGDGLYSKGVVIGVGNSTIKIGNLVGAIIGAVILASFGYVQGFFMMAGIYLIASAIMFYLFIHEFHNKRINII